MKEVLRLVDAEQQHGSNANTLRRYNLEIFRGEIIVVYGLAGSCLTGLLNLMDGTDGLTGGKIYIHEEEAPMRRDESALWKKIHVCGDIRSQFENLSVAENLDLLSEKRPMYQNYSRKKTLERAARYLESEGLDIDPGAKIRTLSYTDRLCLNLLHAKMAHASLVVLDSMKHVYENESVNAMIRRLKAEGMSFLLLSYREDIYYHLADRIQRIDYVRDVMEWCPAYRTRSSTRSLQPPKPISAAQIEGFWDEWANYVDVQEYLEAVRLHNSDYWKKALNFPIPGKDMCVLRGTVLIPRDSSQLLVETLSVADNVILPIQKRVGRGMLGYIPPHVAKNAVQEFYRSTGISPDKKQIGELTLVERKILSLYRWVQARPRVMVLQSPHFGMDRMESGQLDDYLLYIASLGTRLYLLSGSLENLKILCCRITVTNQGENAHRYKEL